MPSELSKPIAFRSQFPVSLTEAYEGIGDVHQKSDLFREAKVWFQKGVEILKDLQEQGKLKHPEILDELAKKMVKCETALAKVQ